jgi:endonuclease/exonuclease/phosphatase family metal-dependent hydrolase
MAAFRIATFNLENLDDEPETSPTLAERIAIMRPQLMRVRADILCLQEVHSQQGPTGGRTLAALDALLAGTPYAGFHRATTVTTGGDLYDVRNLVTLSARPVLPSRIIRDSHGPRPRYQMATATPPDPSADAVQWERPLLCTPIDMGNLRTLHVINLHLKSKIASNIPGQKINDYTWRSVSAWAEGSFISAMKRVGQALQIRLEVDRLFTEHGHDTWIAVCGDFNAEAHEVEIRAICGPVEETGNPEHSPRTMVPCEKNVADSSRYSLLHLGHGEMIDHVIVSRGLLGRFSHAEIHNEALPDESGAFRVDATFPESDHAPVIAQFELD